MYQIGDKVIIKEGHIVNDYCEANRIDGEICAYFGSDMQKYIGKIAVIIGINYPSLGKYQITVDGVDTCANWTDCMLLPYKQSGLKQYTLRGGEIMKKDFVIKRKEKETKIPYKSFLMGIELETLVPYDSSETVNDKAETLGFSNKGDGSIESEEEAEGIEYVTREPMHYTELKTQVKKLTEVFADNDVFINTSCGFHFHVSNKRFFSSTVMNRIIFTWSAIEDFLLSTQPKSRANNSYCRRYLLQYVDDLKNNQKLAKKKNMLVSQLNRDRYKTLNLTALHDHGTIEIRLHAGTTQYKKIIAWIDLLLAFYTYCLKDYNHKEVTQLFLQPISEKKIDNICNMLSLSDKQADYFKSRTHKFLFETLAKQQESAGKIIKNIKTIQKAKKDVEKANEKFNIINDAFNQEYRNLQV